MKEQLLRLRRARYEFKDAEKEVFELLKQRQLRAEAMIQYNLLLGELYQSTAITASRQMSTRLAIIVATMAWKQGFRNTKLYTTIDGQEGIGCVVLRY